MNESTQRTVFTAASKPLKGQFEVQGDKSISHRAAIIASMACGESIIDNFAQGEDVTSTLNCLRALGIGVNFRSKKKVSIVGRGLEGYTEPEDVLNAGNSATTMRLLSGVLAGQDIFAIFTGDDSLKNRPMGRIVEPLKSMGADINGRHKGKYAPLAISGGKLEGRRHMLFLSSAQVKSCLLFAGLLAEGQTSVIVPAESRDHTERLLKFSEVDLLKEDMILTVGKDRMRREPKPFILKVPGDISSAAFLLGAAAVIEGSVVEAHNVGINPTRTGFLNILSKAGVTVEVFESTSYGPEPVGDVSVEYSGFSSFHIKESEVPNMIDEIPLLVVLATQGEKQSTIEGVGELRIKESDRVETLTEGLLAMGARIEVEKNSITIYPSKLKGAKVDSKGDHRIAMSFAVAGLMADGETKVEGFECVAVSYPNFEEDLRMLLK